MRPVWLSFYSHAALGRLFHLPNLSRSFLLPNVKRNSFNSQMAYQAGLVRSKRKDIINEYLSTTHITWGTNYSHRTRWHRWRRKQFWELSCREDSCWPEEPSTHPSLSSQQVDVQNRVPGCREEKANVLSISCRLVPGRSSYIRLHTSCYGNRSLWSDVKGRSGLVWK